MKQNNAIVIVVNGEFIRYAKTLINSIRTNWPDYPTILLFISADVSNEQEDWFKKIPRLQLKRFNSKDYEYSSYLYTGSGKFDSDGFNDAGFYILNFWGDLLSEFDNILILDADMLVLKDLTPFLEENSFFGVDAVNNRVFPAFSFDEPILSKFISFTSTYLRAIANGIFLPPYTSLNSDVIRLTAADRSAWNYQFMMKLLKHFRKSCPSDQELILLWTIKTRKKISQDFRMNFQARFYNEMAENNLPKHYLDKIRQSAEDVHILHFNGPKPDSSSFLTHPWTRDRTELVELYQKYSKMN